MRTLSSENLDEDGLGTAYETFYGDDHQNQPHETHHHIVARITYQLNHPGGGTHDIEGDEVNHGDRANHNGLHLYGGGILHQHDGVGDGSWATENGDAQRGDGDVGGIGLNLFVLQFDWCIARLKHVKANLKDDEATGNAEAVG